MKKETKQTIAIVLMAISLFLADNVFSQPFLSMGAGDKGIQFQLGVLNEGTEITFSYKTPMTKNDVAKIASLSFGKQILLSNREEDNYSLTPSIGMANYRVKDFSKYDAGEDNIIQVSQFKPVYSIELGKDAYMGRMFISASYCRNPYFVVGFKVFPYRN